jgi:DNA-binding SARP family transcriptional activator/streptogramin lyase
LSSLYPRLQPRYNPGVDFRILGPLQVLDREGEVPLGSPKERAVLAVLLLHSGAVVSRQRLIDALWGDLAPPTAAKALNVHVSQLRKTLARNEDDPIATRSPGYVIEVEPARLDAARFEQLVTEAREHVGAGDLQDAGRLLREALALWRGPALDAIELESAARNEVGRLEELRLAAQIDRIDCDLALGLHEQLIAELELLVAGHPLQERLRAQLMLAFYRAGRQADALRCYRQTRDTLVGELGIEPSAALQRLEKGILNHDPALERPAGVPRANGAHVEGRAVTGRRRMSKRARWLLAGAAATVLGAGISAGVIELVGGAAPVVVRAIPVDSVGAIDPDSGRIALTVSVPGGPDRLAAGNGRLWVTRSSDHALVAVGIRRAAIARIVDPGVDTSDVEVGPAGVWVLGSDGTLAQVDPLFGSTILKLRVNPVGLDVGHAGAFGQPTPMSVGKRNVWIADLAQGIVRIDSATRRRLRLKVGRVDGLALGDGAVWAVGGPTATVLRIDPRTNRVTARIPIVSGPNFESPFPYAIAVGAGFVWVVNGNTGTVTKIDPALRGVVATIPIGVGANVLGIAVGDGAAWITNSSKGTLVRIDAVSNRPKSIPLGPNQLHDVVVADQKVWVSVQRSILSP